MVIAKFEFNSDIETYYLFLGFFRKEISILPFYLIASGQEGFKNSPTN